MEKKDQEKKVNGKKSQEKLTEKKTERIFPPKINGAAEKKAPVTAPVKEEKKPPKNDPPKTAPKADPEKESPKKDLPKKDAFGFRQGCNASLFCGMVKDAGDKGITMEDVKKAKWNTNHATYFGTLSAMKKQGHAKVENGRIHYVK